MNVYYITKFNSLWMQEFHQDLTLKLFEMAIQIMNNTGMHELALTGDAYCS